MNNGTMIDRLNLEGKLKPYSSSIEPGENYSTLFDKKKNIYKILNLYMFPDIQKFISTSSIQN